MNIIEHVLNRGPIPDTGEEVHVSFNFVTLGSDCSPAAALRNLKLRKYALPFDWVTASVDAIINCVNDDFREFHHNLVNHQTEVRDSYGIVFPHDYPTVHIPKNQPLEIESDNTFIHSSNIRDDWESFISTVVEKYKRRINRFLQIMNSHEPVIALIRASIADVCRLKNLFDVKYNKKNIVFVVGQQSSDEFENSFIVTCHPEKNDVWNEVHIWRECIDRACAKLEVHLD